MADQEIARSERIVLLTVHVIADRLGGVSRRHVRELCRTGKLKASRIGNGWRVKPTDLDAFIESRSNHTL